jgi:hypothetical protein
MNIGEIFNQTNYLLNKEQFGAKLTVANFNRLAEFVQYDVIKQRYGLPEEYTPGAPIPRMSWEVTQKMTDDLKHLKVHYGGQTFPMLPVSTSGIAQIPSDYMHFSSAYYKYQKTVNGQAVEKWSSIENLTDFEWAARHENPNRTPSIKAPACKFQDTYIEFSPKSLGYVDFTYLRKPTAPVYAVTIVSTPTQDYQQYDPTNSVQLELPDDMHSDFVNLMVNRAAIHLRSAEMYQISENRQNKGI